MEDWGGDVFKGDAEKSLPGAARRPDTSGSVSPQEETANWVARTLSILGVLGAEDNASFVPPGAHGWRGKGVESCWLGWGKRETRTYLFANRYSHGPLRTSRKNIN